MDFFRNPRAAGFGSAVAHPLVTRTAPTPAPRPQPIPAQQVPTSRPFPAPQQQASQTGLHPSTLLYEKWILRPWEAESNEQDVKMTLQYQNYDTQQGRKVWLSGAFNDYLKQGIEPPPKVKEYFKSQGFDYDEVKTPTTEWASLPDRDKAGLLTAYYEGKLRDPWQQKTVARMIQQEAEDAKKLPAPGGDTTPAHLRWLQEWYKQNVDPAKTPAKLQEQFVASKLVEEPAYTLNPAYTKYLEGMKASGLSLDDPSQWAERQEYYKANPRPAKYLQGKEKTPGWVSPEEAQKISAQNAQANRPAQAAAPAEATVPPAQAVGLRTQSPGYEAGTGTFTAQGPGGFTETLGQPAPPKPPAPSKPPAPPVAQAPASTVGAAMGQQAAGVLGPSPVVQPGTPQPVAAQPSPVVKKQGGRQKPIAVPKSTAFSPTAVPSVRASASEWVDWTAANAPDAAYQAILDAKNKYIKDYELARQVPGTISQGLSEFDVSISNPVSEFNAAAEKILVPGVLTRNAFERILAGRETEKDVRQLKYRRGLTPQQVRKIFGPEFTRVAKNRIIQQEAKAWLKEKEQRGTYVGGKKRNLRGKPSVSSEMKRIVGESTWNKAMGGK